MLTVLCATFARQRYPCTGYLSHEKTPTPLGTPLDPRHRPTVESLGFAFYCQARYPCHAWVRLGSRVTCLDASRFARVCVRLCGSMQGYLAHKK